MAVKGNASEIVIAYIAKGTVTKSGENDKLTGGDSAEFFSSNLQASNYGGRSNGESVKTTALIHGNIQDLTGNGGNDRLAATIGGYLGIGGEAVIQGNTVRLTGNSGDDSLSLGIGVGGYNGSSYSIASNTVKMWGGDGNDNLGLSLSKTYQDPGAALNVGSNRIDMDGDDGNDTFSITANFIETSNSITVRGGGGTDRATVSYTGSDAIVADLTAGSIAALGLSFSGIESFEVSSGRGDDILRGGTGNDLLDAGTGGGTVSGGGGEDRIVASIFSGPTADDKPVETNGRSLTLAGGEGDDSITADSSTTGAASSRNTLIIDGDGGADDISLDIAASAYSGLAATVFENSFSANGGAGDDDLRGGFDAAGSVAGARISLNTVSIKGGAGNDTVSFSLEAGIEEGDTAAIVGNGITLLGEAGNDEISLTLDAMTDDIVTGAAIKNNTVVFDGGVGDDVLAVQTYGLYENKLTLRGGEGKDTFDFSYEGPQAITLDFSKSYDQTVLGITLTGIEGVAIETYEGDDRLTGGVGADTLEGGDGNDRLDGGRGVDHLEGGDGDDRYDVDSASDVVDEDEGAGYDVVYAASDYALTFSARGVEELRANAGSRGVALTGNTGDNLIFGGAGADTLRGGGGEDRLEGGLGDDTYILDDSTVTLVEKAKGGSDTIQTSKTYSLKDINIENLILTGTGAANGSGTSLANRIVGNAGDNVLNGYGGDDILDASAGGRDTLYGGTGNDTYIVSSTTTVLFEGGAGQGVDLVRSSVSYTLGTFFENLELLGSGALNGTGNALDNRLTGNAGKNTLDGKVGADVMAGGQGDDSYVVDNARDQVLEGKGQGKDTLTSSVSYTLAAGQEIESLQFAKTTGATALNLTGNEFGQTIVGNAGANSLEGKGGIDILTGGRGSDTFVFGSALGSSNIDRITDFATEDTIRLDDAIFRGLAPGQLKAGEFKDIGKAKVDADDHILYDSRTGSLFYDADGSGKAVAVKFAVLDNKAAITHADFLIA